MRRHASGQSSRARQRDDAAAMWQRIGGLVAQLRAESIREGRRQLFDGLYSRLDRIAMEAEEAPTERPAIQWKMAVQGTMRWLRRTVHEHRRE